MKVKKALVVNDFHIRPKGVNSPYYHDKEAINLVVRVAKVEHPDLILLNGDVVENAEFSPWTKYDITFLHDAVEEFKRVIRPFLKYRCVYLAGNHELWANKYLAQFNQQQLWKNLKDGVDQHEQNYEIQKLGVEYRPYRGQVQPHFDLGSLYVYHGDMVRAHSAYTAKAVLDRAGSSVLIGHTHRIGSSFKTVGFPDDYTIHGAWENGCLCRLDESFGGKATTSNWQQGFALVHYEDKKHGWFHVQQVPIIDGKFMMEGKLYRS